MKWLELHLDMNPAGIEPATELLSAYGTMSQANGIDSLMIDEEGDFKDFLENNHQYWDYVDEDLMQSMHGKSRITFYLEDSEEGFNTLAQFRIGLAAFKKQHPEYAPLILSMENVEDADWENNWKQFYKPMEIGERLLVVPEWEQAEGDGRVKLILNPGLTFGTGSHATTRLCLQALEKHIHGGEKVLDLGCGSGILSIAALLLGALFLALNLLSGKLHTNSYLVVMRYTPEGESAVRSKLGTLGKYKLKSRTMNLAETELVVEAKLSQKQMDSLEALLDNEGVSDVNIVSYNGSTLL